MCYNASYLKKKIKKAAERLGKTIDDAVLPEDWHYVSAFTHPAIPIISIEKPELVQPYVWGLIPEWVNDDETALKIQRSTPNARSETIYDKPSFRDAAQNGQRCIIMSTGFFEYHHKSGKKIPYYIHEKDTEVTYFAGIYSHWQKSEQEVKNTVSMLTTSANPLMTEIHNNPKVLESTGPRMPVILSENQINDWLDPTLSKEEVETFFTPFDENMMVAYTVPPITGKGGVGNSEKAKMHFSYPEMNMLF